MSIIRDFAKFIEPTGQLEYDNTNSGLSADTIKSAIDEINVLVGGGNVGSQATFSVYEFVASGGQTVFNLASTFTTGLDVTAGDFVIGTKYTITATNTTDFTAIGAVDSNPGTVFEATGAGTGTGTAKLSVTYVPGYIQVYLNGIFLAAEDYNATDGELLTLTEAAEASDLLSIVVLDSLNMALLLKVTNIDSNAPENLLSVDSSGNVGLGTAAPVNTLHVDDAAGGTVRVTRLGTSPTAYGRFEHDGTNTSITSSAELIFNTNAAPAMRIDASGNVGIGTSTPASTTKLHLSGSGTTYMRVENTITGVTSDFGTTSVGTTIINRSATPILFFTDSAERLRIDATGNVGIAVPPEAWNANSTALDIGSLTTLWNDTSQSILSHNVYKNVSGILAYRTTAEASYYEQNAGNHIWYNAVSGTNDADITTMTERARIDTSGNFVLPDNGKAIFGDGSDLQIYHHPTDGSFIVDNGTGNLQLDATDFRVRNTAGTEAMIHANADGAVKLFYNGTATPKLETTATGIDVAGSVTADGLTVSGDSISFNTTAGDLDINPLGGGSVEIESSGTLGVKVGGTSGFLVTDASDNNIFKAALDGDISFYEATGTTPKFEWSSSAESLTITGNSNAWTIDNTTIYGNRAGGSIYVGNSSATGEFGITSGGAVVMQFDTSGNVGIGQDTPKTTLNLGANNSGQGAILTLENTDTSLTTNDVIGQIDFYANDGSTNGTGVKVNIKAIAASTAGTVTALTFGTSDSASATAVEAMRIDASGNLLVGKTAASFGTAGVAVFGSGEIDITNTNEAPLFLNRLGSDGVIQYFYKDGGAAVGSIGAANGNLYLGQGDTTIMFSASSDAVLPKGTDGADRDGFINLGQNINRFKDLHLSGGVYTGGDVFVYSYSGGTYGQVRSGLKLDGTNSRLEFYTGQDERMRIDASGDLNLVKNGLTSLNFTTDGSLDYARITGGKSGSGVGELQFWAYSGGMFRASTIDSDGNLLVGRTNPSFGNTGHLLAPSGFVYHERDGGDSVMYLNRLSSDGDIVRFYKDTVTQVGSIGTLDGNSIYIGNGDVNLRMIGVTNKIVPATSAGANRDAAVNLGDASARFKDLYLSGSVVHTFDVVNNGTTDYQFSDTGSNWFPTAENDPVLYLRRGETYIFSVVAGGHPFEIRVSNGGAAYTTGVTNNGAQNGDVVFKVPMSAPSTLYYQCTVHSGMGNIINIV